MVWKREPIFNIWAQAVKDIIESSNHEIIVVCAGSCPQDRTMVVNHGFYYVHTPNVPLGRKAQKRLDVCKGLNADKVLFLGSDDIVSRETFEYIVSRHAEHTASMDLYYWADNKLVYSQGYINDRKGEPMAVGRCLTSSFLDRIGWRLWNKKLLRFIDKSASKMIRSGEPTSHYYWLRTTNNMVLDIKSAESLTPFQWRLNYEKTRVRIEDHFSETVCQMLRNA